ncbi:hypothetical protein ACFQ9X_33560 [Catenulispora yoronensis]
MPTRRSILLASAARLAAVAAAAAMTTALAACGSGGGSPASALGNAEAAGTPVDGGKLTYAMDQEPDCIDPHVSGLDAVAVIDRNIVDSLVAQAPTARSCRGWPPRGPPRRI